VNVQVRRTSNGPCSVHCDHMFITKFPSLEAKTYHQGAKLRDCQRGIHTASGINSQFDQCGSAFANDRVPVSWVQFNYVRGANGGDKSANNQRKGKPHDGEKRER